MFLEFLVFKKKLSCWLWC